MGKIIAFNPSHAKKSALNAVKPDGKPCNTPIRVKRTSLETISVGFFVGCFNAALVESAMKTIAYGQKWRLTAITEDHALYDQKYQTFAIRMFDCKTELEFRAAVMQVMFQISHVVYTDAVALFGEYVAIEELAKPRGCDLATGAFISHRAAAILKNVGIKNVYELSRKTREELAQLPGMDTETIFRIEKSLAIRGIFLNIEPVQKWKKAAL